jgi:pimeloyl-ACP methyl ester carboxylesterase
VASDDRTRPLRTSLRLRAAAIIGGAALLVSSGCAVTTQEAEAPSSAQLGASPDSIPDAEVRERTLEVSSAGGDVRVSYCGNGSLGKTNATVQRVVIVIHGDRRNSCDYAAFVERAASAADQIDSTLAVAPRFITEADDADGRRLARWSESGWKSGDASIGGGRSGRAAISSYAVVDEILAQLAVPGRFPALNQVTIAGHSAGGQFVNRYAATTSSTDVLPATVTRQYVVANPSSYLYLTPLRPDRGLLAPVNAEEEESCPGYNSYKYGLEGLNSYADRSSQDTIRVRYSTSRVTYLLGGADTRTDNNLDDGCEARLQGPQRLARGEKFFASLGVLFGQGIYARHREVIVPGVGHDAEAMFNSLPGRDALFAVPDA